MTELMIMLFMPTVKVSALPAAVATWLSVTWVGLSTDTT